MCIFCSNCFLMCTAYLEIKTAAAILPESVRSHSRLMVRRSCLTDFLGSSVLKVMEPQSKYIICISDQLFCLTMIEMYIFKKI